MTLDQSKRERFDVDIPVDIRGMRETEDRVVRQRIQSGRIRQSY